MSIARRVVLAGMAVSVSMLAGCTHGFRGTSRPGKRVPYEAKTSADALLTSLAALPDTPLGRYEKSVRYAIGTQWYAQMDVHRDLIVRDTRIRLHFYVTRTGRLRGVRVSKGDPGSALAALSIKAVSAANIPPIPTTLANKLRHGELEVSMGFDYLF